MEFSYKRRNGISIIIRTGWLFGGHQKKHYKFVETVINNLYTNTPIYASNNFFGSPTYVIDFIDKMKELILNHEYGIHHIVNEGAASGYDIAIEISKLLNMDVSLITEVNHVNIPNSGPNRSQSEILITINNQMRNWKIALKEYVNKYVYSKLNKNIPEFKETDI